MVFSTFIWVIPIALIGSPHCGIMCGGISSLAVRTRSDGWRFHFGRLAAYTLLASLFGALAQNLTEAFARRAAWAQSLVFALAIFLIAQGIAQFKIPGTEFIYRKVSGFLKNRSAFTLGMGAVLIPCGWFFSILLWLTMLGNFWSVLAGVVFFWAGTLPIFWLIQRIRQKLIPSQFTGPALAIAGIFALMLRLSPIHPEELNSLRFWIQEWTGAPKNLPILELECMP